MRPAKKIGVKNFFLPTLENNKREVDKLSMRHLAWGRKYEKHSVNKKIKKKKVGS